jgi:hypothetical protein
VIEVEFAVTVNSGGGGEVTSRNAWTLWDSFPLDPVRFSTNVPVGVDVGTRTDKIAFAVPVRSETELGFAATIILDRGGVAFRFTLPAKL